ncbi:MAG: hypothetical protein QOD06_1133 [Candidatus Binatota bacterium]|nr:hypothetical protein [Candidatus Binatota bacterium]
MDALSNRRTIAGLFVISMAALLLEIALTRVFAVVLWSHLTPMIVGTALFGFGLSGLYAHFFDRPRSPAALALGFAGGVLVVLLVIAEVPLRIWDFGAQELQLQAALLAIYYLALLVPFFAIGLAILRIFSASSIGIGRLYAADLFGAGAGTAVLVPLLPELGGEGTIVFCAALAAAGAVLLAGSRRAQWLAVTATVALGVFATQASRVVPLVPHQAKRQFNVDVQRGRIEYTVWSALSRVDVGAMTRAVKRIWIDGGTNESKMFHRPRQEFGSEPWKRHSVYLPYFLKEGSLGRVLVVGPAGGKEVFLALHGGAASVDAVELDAGVVQVVGSAYDDFLKGLYHRPRVHLHNDEARSFVRRSRERYDVIQSVANYTPAALVSGALNLSESFLLTKEAFHDYLDHLNPGGIVSFHRGASLRIAAMAAEVLEERGVTNPGRSLIVVATGQTFFEGVLVKNGEFSPEEIARVERYLAAKKVPAYYLAGRGNPLYVRIIESPDRRALYHSLGVDLSPPTDDRPFLDHYTRFGDRGVDPRLPVEFRYFAKLKWWGAVPQGDISYVAILVESAVLGLLLIGLPILFARRRGTDPVDPGVLLYFACLGVGFILVELCLMKSVILFLGHPTYSISVVLFTVLVGAALGSLASDRVARTRRVILALVVLLAVEAMILPLLFRAALGLGFTARVAVAIGLLLPLAVGMGVPFPTAFRMLRERAPSQLPLAWALNGYGTVLGSGLCVFLAVFLGFRATYAVACALYAVAAFAFPRRLEDASAGAGAAAPALGVSGRRVVG